MRRWIRRFVQLEKTDRRLLLRTGGVLAAARLCIWVLPFNTARRLIVPPPPARPALRLAPDRVRWAIGIAQRLIPDATCLPQAIAAESLLTRDGHAVALRIGVLKNAAGALEAHAWVECEGRVIVGDLPEGLGKYTQLPPLPPAHPPTPAEPRQPQPHAASAATAGFPVRPARPA